MAEKRYVIEHFFNKELLDTKTVIGRHALNRALINLGVPQKAITGHDYRSVIIGSQTIKWRLN